jgi:hypothetical protein
MPPEVSRLRALVDADVLTAVLARVQIRDDPFELLVAR